MDLEKEPVTIRAAPLHEKTARWPQFSRVSNFTKTIVLLGIACVLLVVTLAIVAFLYLPGPIPAVTLYQGTFQGALLYRNDFDKVVEAYLGIPYALPVVGDLRFARPKHVLASNDTFDAIKYGPSCPGKQLIPIPGVDNSDEDCLTVNVFKPSGEKNTKLPVGVYFHGGAFTRGASKSHDTASMVSWAEPLVAVSFNYRLGALGFLNSALTEEEGVLNLGLHDQVLLLEWVQENIAAFGGDPDQVTIFGLSAGAHSIGHHIYNNKSTFHRAIMESGGPFSRALHPWNSTLNKQQADLFMSKVGCQDIACLRAANITDLLNASNSVFDQWNPSLRWAWQPVIDDDIVPGRPLNETAPSIPILTGFNTNEGSLYVPQNLSTSAQFDAFFTTLLPQLNHTTTTSSSSKHENVSTIYPASAYPEWRHTGAQYRRLEAAYGQYAYSCAVRQTASTFTGDVYLYHWAVNRTVMGGANHGDQVAYETMNPDVRSVSATQDELARLFHGYITSFIVRGDPNGDERLEWARYSGGDTGDHRDDEGESGKTMVIGLGNDERAGGTDKGVVAQFVLDGWALDECAYWRSVSGLYED